VQIKRIWEKVSTCWTTVFQKPLPNSKVKPL